MAIKINLLDRFDFRPPKILRSPKSDLVGWSPLRNASMTLSSARHILENGYGLRMDRDKGFIDQKLFSRGSALFLSDWGHSSWGSFFEARGFSREFRLAGLQDEGTRASDILVKLYPWAFDLSKQKHLHSWEVDKEFVWRGKEDIKAAICHTAKEAGLNIFRVDKAVTSQWLREQRFSGVLGYFNGSVGELIRYVFAQEQERRILDAPIFSPIPGGGSKALRKIEKGEVAGEPAGVLSVKGKQIFVAESLVGYAVRRVSRDFFLLYRPVPLEENSGIVYKPRYLLSTKLSGKADRIIPERSLLSPFVDVEVPDSKALEVVDDIIRKTRKSVLNLTLRQQSAYAQIVKFYRSRQLWHERLSEILPFVDPRLVPLNVYKIKHLGRNSYVVFDPKVHKFSPADMPIVAKLTRQIGKAKFIPRKMESFLETLKDGVWNCAGRSKAKGALKDLFKKVSPEQQATLYFNLYFVSLHENEPARHRLFRGMIEHLSALTSDELDKSLDQLNEGIHHIRRTKHSNPHGELEKFAAEEMGISISDGQGEPRLTAN